MGDRREDHLFGRDEESQLRQRGTLADRLQVRGLAGVVGAGDDHGVAAFQGQVVAPDAFMAEDEIRIERFTDLQRRVGKRLWDAQGIAAVLKSFQAQQSHLVEGQRFTKIHQGRKFLQVLTLRLELFEDLFSLADLGFPLFLGCVFDIFIKVGSVETAVVDKFRPEAQRRLGRIVKGKKRVQWDLGNGILFVAKVDMAFGGDDAHLLRITVFPHIESDLDIAGQRKRRIQLVKRLSQLSEERLLPEQTEIIGEQFATLGSCHSAVLRLKDLSEHLYDSLVCGQAPPAVQYRLETGRGRGGLLVFLIQLVQRIDPFLQISRIGQAGQILEEGGALGDLSGRRGKVAARERGRRLLIHPRIDQAQDAGQIEIRERLLELFKRGQRGLGIGCQKILG